MPRMTSKMFTTALHCRKSKSWGQLSSRYTKSFGSATATMFWSCQDGGKLHVHRKKKWQWETRSHLKRWTYMFQAHPNLCWWYLSVQLFQVLWQWLQSSLLDLELASIRTNERSEFSKHNNHSILKFIKKKTEPWNHYLKAATMHAAQINTTKAPTTHYHKQN